MEDIINWCLPNSNIMPDGRREKRERGRRGERG
jgi:hypothetical protein